MFSSDWRLEEIRRFGWEWFELWNESVLCELICFGSIILLNYPFGWCNDGRSSSSNPRNLFMKFKIDRDPNILRFWACLKPAINALKIHKKNFSAHDQGQSRFDQSLQNPINLPQSVTTWPLRPAAFQTHAPWQPFLGPPFHASTKASNSHCTAAHRRYKPKSTSKVTRVQITPERAVKIENREPPICVALVVKCQSGRSMLLGLHNYAISAVTNNSKKMTVVRPVRDVVHYLGHRNLRHLQHSARGVVSFGLMERWSPWCQRKKNAKHDNFLVLAVNPRRLESFEHKPRNESKTCFWSLV